MKIGDLALKTQISIRTLHHYDELGLLKPSVRTLAGHRDYSEQDIERLYKIISLKNVGFSLEEIKSILGISVSDFDHKIEEQLFHTEEEIKNLEKRKWCIESVQYLIGLECYQSVDMYIGLINELNIQAQYFTPEERLEIQKINYSLGRDKIRHMHTEMNHLVSELNKLIDTQTSPQDEKAIELCDRWKKLGAESISGNQELKSKIQKMFAEHPELTSYRGINQRLLNFISSINAN